MASNNYFKAIRGELRGGSAAEDRRARFDEAFAFFDDGDREDARRALADVRAAVPGGVVSVWRGAGTIPLGMLVVGEASDVMRPGMRGGGA